MNMALTNYGSERVLQLLKWCIVFVVTLMPLRSLCMRNMLQCQKLIAPVATILLTISPCSPAIAVSEDKRGGVSFQGIVNSKLLESYRVIDQVDFDSTTAANTNKFFLLLPIVKLNEDFVDLQEALQRGDQTRFMEYSEQLATPAYSTASLKKIFNRYADNIFYTNPDRFNMYLGGGAVPDTSQTTQYLLRNDILNKIDDIKIDLQLLDPLSAQKKTISGNQKDDRMRQHYVDDALDDCKQLLASFSEYLQLADSNDIQLARQQVWPRISSSPL